MSGDLYATCLIWTGHRGVAKLHGERQILAATPQVPGLDLAHIEYMPEVRVARCCERCGPWRDLERFEVKAIDVWLFDLFRQERLAP